MFVKFFDTASKFEFFFRTKNRDIFVFNLRSHTQDPCYNAFTHRNYLPAIDEPQRTDLFAQQERSRAALAQIRPPIMYDPAPRAPTSHPPPPPSSDAAPNVPPALKGGAVLPTLMDNFLMFPETNLFNAKVQQSRPLATAEAQAQERFRAGGKENFAGEAALAVSIGRAIECRDLSDSLETGTVEEQQQSRSAKSDFVEEKFGDQNFRVFSIFEFWLKLSWRFWIL